MYTEDHLRIPDRRQLCAFRQDVLVEPGPERITVATRWGDVAVDDVGEVLRKPLERMTLGLVSLDNITPHDDLAAERFHQVLGSLTHSVVRAMASHDGGEPPLAAIPIARTANLRLAKLGPAEPIRLSRFTAIRADDDELVVESPRSDYRVVLQRQVAACVVTSLCRTTTAARLAEELTIAEALVTNVVDYLIATKMVLVGEPSAEGARFAENDDPGLRSWSHHDLLFHSRTRIGQHDAPLGATFAEVGRTPPAPVVKPPPDGERFPLYRPELDALADRDRTVTEVLETRVPRRGAPGTAPSPEQLGELLFRAARVRSTERVSACNTEYTVSDRPYPSSGGAYELELYLAINDCADLPRGLHHYDPAQHALTLLSPPEPEFAELLETAKTSAGSAEWPPVLVVITTRIARLSWVYSGITYATALKHVGILQQTLHLVSTAMGLLPCALPVGDGLASNRTLRLNWPAEVGVGEFLVSAPPAEPAGEQRAL